MDKQDRTLWDPRRSPKELSSSPPRYRKGLWACISFRQRLPPFTTKPRRVEETDWPQILALYELLKRVSPSPMVTLNHAIAVAMVHGPAKGLELLRALDSDPRISGHYRLDAVRAHLFEKTGDYETAIRHYRIAAARTRSMPERNYLMTQAARLAGD